MPDQITDPLLLQAALIGLQQMKTDLDGKMSDLRRRLGMTAEAGNAQPSPKKAARKKRRLSAAGRANIVAALKKRWAKLHKQQEQARIAPKAAPKREATSATAKTLAKRAAKKAGAAVKRAPGRSGAAKGSARRPRAKTAVRKTAEAKPAPVTTPEPTPPVTEA
jgi:hypothetical protein